MFNVIHNRSNSIAQRLLLTMGVAVVLVIAGCNKHQANSAESGPRTFASPQDAGQALENAAKSQDLDEIMRIFGPEAKEILASGDPIENKAALSGFAQSYQTMNRWRRLPDGGQLLVVGADNNVFPIPLMKNSAGDWYWNTAAGKEEILSRRIGRNELNAISVCSAAADAQQQYFGQKHVYAQKFLSDSGQQNGLYWQSAQGAPRSPLGPLVAYATDEGYKVQPGHHQPFNGYYFVMLTRQGSGAPGGAKEYIANGRMTGGFAILAYPAQYGNSGIMTFLVNQDGVVLQKDLGKDTAQVAAAITEFNPDNTWAVVDEQPQQPVNQPPRATRLAANGTAR